jgi:serine/threonine protein phosphatase PrpC
MQEQSGSAPGFEAARCESCRNDVDPDGFCTTCGLRQSRPNDHVEVDLVHLASVSDRGLHHYRNEDAVAVVLGGTRAGAVVCDGVSSTANADSASAAASTAALAVLREAIEGARADDPDDAARALQRAVAAARHAAAIVASTEAAASTGAPSTTFVAVVVAPGTVTVANVGDSRAYWIAPGQAEVLTVDDSWAEMAIAAGASPSEAYSSPRAHTITRWVGADSDNRPAAITTWPVDREGTVFVCSDGLWNYFPTADEIRAVLDQLGPAAPIAVARHLVAAALAAGGHDNVTVVVIPAGPAGISSPATH